MASSLDFRRALFLLTLAVLALLLVSGMAGALREGRIPTLVDHTGIDTLISQQRFAEAQEQLRIASAIDIENEPAYLIQRQRLATHLRDRDEQIEVLRRMIELDPNPAPLHQHLADMLLARAMPGPEQLEEAEYHIRQAIALAPDTAAMYDKLGRILHAQGNTEAGLDAFRTALRLEREAGTARPIATALQRNPELRRAYPQLWTSLEGTP